MCGCPGADWLILLCLDGTCRAVSTRQLLLHTPHKSGIDSCSLTRSKVERLTLPKCREPACELVSFLPVEADITALPELLGHGRRWWGPAGWLWTGWSDTSGPGNTWSSVERGWTNTHTHLVHISDWASFAMTVVWNSAYASKTIDLSRLLKTLWFYSATPCYWNMTCTIRQYETNICKKQTFKHGAEVEGLYSARQYHSAVEL